MTDTLTDTEQAVLADASDAGFLIASGNRLQVLRAWRERCRRRGVPCVTVRRLARQSLIEVDGETAWKGRPDEAERRAASYAVKTGGQEMLF